MALIREHQEQQEAQMNPISKPPVIFKPTEEYLKMSPPIYDKREVIKMNAGIVKPLTQQ